MQIDMTIKEFLDEYGATAMQPGNHTDDGFQKPRRYYALCLGTFPINEARRLRNYMKESPSCNVEFKFRGRGNRKTKYGAHAPFPAHKNCDLTLKDAQMVAVYVSLKRSLLKGMDVAKVRDKMLRAAGYRY